MAELRHPNEIAMEKEHADYLKNIDKIDKARNTPHPNQVAAEEEQAARDRQARAAVRAEARATHAVEPAPAAAPEPPKPEPKDGE